MKKQNGFSLVELLIAMGIIGLIVAVSAVAWNAAVTSGNEASAIKLLEKLSRAQVQFASKNKGHFAESFEALIAEGVLDERFLSAPPSVNGYTFELKKQEKPPFFSIKADPESDSWPAATGIRHFYIDSSLEVIKFTKEKRPANPSDQAL